MKKIGAMKKVVAFMLSAMLMVCLGACGSSSSDGSASADKEAQTLNKVLKNGKLTVVLNIGNAPWTYKDDSTGEYTGMAVELIQGYCDQLGVECSIEPLEFSSLISSVNSGKADIICTNLSRTVERSTNVMFSDPVGIDYGVVICKKGAFSSLDEVNQEGVTLTTETGFSFEGVVADVFPNATMSAVDTTPNALAAVNAGRADGMVTNLAIAKELVAANEGLEIMEDYCYTDVMAFAVDNTYLNTTLLGSFNSYLRNIKSNGTYGEIYEKYIGTKWEPTYTDSAV